MILTFRIAIALAWVLPWGWVYYAQRRKRKTLAHLKRAIGGK